MQSDLKHFWCHNCKCDLFQPQSNFRCFVCFSELIEEVDRNCPHPSTFIPVRPNQVQRPLPELIFSSRILHFIVNNNGEGIPAGEDAILRLESIEGNNSQCPICQEAIQNTAKIMKCKHLFHENCIVPWLRVKNSCPVCRAPV